MHHDHPFTQKPYPEEVNRWLILKFFGGNYLFINIFNINELFYLLLLGYRQNKNQNLMFILGKHYQSYYLFHLMKLK